MPVDQDRSRVYNIGDVASLESGYAFSDLTITALHLVQVLKKKVFPPVLREDA